MKLAEIFKPESIIVSLENTERDAVFEELVEKIALSHPDFNKEKALAAIRERESKMTTGIMSGIAIPHGRIELSQGVLGAIGISKAGINYGSLDNMPVHVVFLMVSSPDASEIHLGVMKKLAQVLMNPEFSKKLQELSSADAVYSALCSAEAGI